MRDKLLSIVNEGTPYGEVLAINTDGETYICLLVDKKHMSILGNVVRRLEDVANFNTETLNGMMYPLSHKEVFDSTVNQKDYFVSKERLEWIQR